MPSARVQALVHGLPSRSPYASPAMPGAVGGEEGRARQRASAGWPRPVRGRAGRLETLIGTRTPFLKRLVCMASCPLNGRCPSPRERLYPPEDKSLHVSEVAQLIVATSCRSDTWSVKGLMTL